MSTSQSLSIKSINPYITWGLRHSSIHQLTSKVSAKASGAAAAVADLGVVVATSTCIAIKTYYVDLVLA